LMLVSDRVIRVGGLERPTIEVKVLDRLSEPMCKS
jgi:hypothetical protein